MFFCNIGKIIIMKNKVVFLISLSFVIFWICLGLFNAFKRFGILGLLLFIVLVIGLSIVSKIKPKL